MFRRGDWVLLIEERGGYKAVVRAGQGSVQTIRGYVDTDALVGTPHGASVVSSIGVRFRAVPASVFDVIEHRFRLGAQAIYPKDAVYIVKAAAVGPGSVVAEAGTGSGFLTAVLAWYVRPWGLVYSFEKRAEHLRIAVRNLTPASAVKKNGLRRRRGRRGGAARAKPQFKTAAFKHKKVRLEKKVGVSPVSPRVSSRIPWPPRRMSAVPWGGTPPSSCLRIPRTA